MSRGFSQVHLPAGEVVSHHACRRPGGHLAADRI